MTVYEHERDLEDTVYSSLVSLWSEFSDTYAVFDQHGPAQLLCAQQVWEALLTNFPLKHKCMQTVLVAREIGRLMAWDGDSKNAVNTHFGKVGDIRRAFEYMGALTIDNAHVARTPSTMPMSSTSKQSMCAHIQTVCARQFRRTKGLHPDSSFIADTLGATPSTSPVKTEKDNKYKHQGGNELASFLCNTLEKHGDQPGKVLSRACLAGNEWNETASVTALFMAAQKHFPRLIPSDTNDDGDTDYDATTAYESDD